MIFFGGFQIRPDNVPIRKPGLYRITNLINGKPYIGIANNIANRAWGHAASAKHGNTKFAKALRKYGVENFLFEPLLYLVDGAIDGRAWLCRIEAEMIAEYDSVRRGYNVIAANGSVGPYGPEFGKIISKSARKWQAEQSAEERAAMRANQSAAAKRRHGTPEASARFGLFMKELWTKPDFVQKQVIANQIRAAINKRLWSNPEHRAERTTKISEGHSLRTDEQKAEATRKRLANTTPEQRSETSRKGHAARTPEQRSVIAYARWAKIPPEERRAAAAEREAAMNSEQRDARKRQLLAARRGAVRQSGTGTRWITDGVTTMRMPEDHVLPNGWRYGRKPSLRAGQKLSPQGQPNPKLDRARNP